MFSIEQRTEFLKKAAALTPKLKRWPVYADALVTPVEDKSVWQNYRMEPSNLDEFLANNDFASGNSFIVKLPETTVGQLAFTIMSPCGYADSPSRLRITLGELPQEVVNATLPYNGPLNGSWLQTEIINIDNLPAEVVLQLMMLRVVQQQILQQGQVVMRLILQQQPIKTAEVILTRQKSAIMERVQRSTLSVKTTVSREMTMNVRLQK